MCACIHLWRRALEITQQQNKNIYTSTLKTLTTKKTHQPNTVSSNTHATTKTTNFKIKIKNRLSQRRTRRLLCVQDTCALTQNTQHTSPQIPQTQPQTHTKKQKQKTKEKRPDSAFVSKVLACACAARSAFHSPELYCPVYAPRNHKVLLHALSSVCSGIV